MGICTIIFVGTKITKVFLFEAAKYYSSNGNYVCYISSKRHDELPMPLLSENLSPNVYIYPLITFVTIPELENLLCYLLKMHAASTLPTMVILENIDEYVNSESDLKTFNLICAYLKDTVQFIDRYCNQNKDNSTTVHLVVSITNLSNERRYASKTIFVSPKIWYAEEILDNDDDDDYVTLTLKTCETNFKKLSYFENQIKFLLTGSGLIYQPTNSGMSLFDTDITNYLLS